MWSTFGDRGEGIVVANIDTGVQFNHPALVGQYRGNLGGGTFDHNYNWFDPSKVCGSPSLVPCDNNSHGTHTMGTMVGDDGDPGPNQIGVAPHARWIAAKGCETNAARTRLCSPRAMDPGADRPSGRQPAARPEAEHRQQLVGRRRRRSLVPGHRQGLDRRGHLPRLLERERRPGLRVVRLARRLHAKLQRRRLRHGNNIAGFSSRGPSAFGGGLKPNIAAPGVNVRSSVPTNSYAAFSGTSMASPHVAGTVALMWSAAPALMGDMAATRAILDSTAVDTSDLPAAARPPTTTSGARASSTPSQQSTTLHGPDRDTDRDGYERKQRRPDRRGNHA